jgi:phage anti-repressor protein/phage antirepressor YoqD-like protein
MRKINRLFNGEETDTGAFCPAGEPGNGDPQAELKERFEEIVQTTEEFPVDFDQAWQWIGYSTKGNAKKILEENFIKGVDFNLIKKNKVQIEGNREIDRPYEAIFLTVDCFKSFCMMARTEKGKEVRKYYIQIEKSWNTIKRITTGALQMCQERGNAARQYLPGPLEGIEIGKSRVQRINKLHRQINMLQQQIEAELEGEITELTAEIGQLKLENRALMLKVSFSGFAPDPESALSMSKTAAVINRPGYGRNRIFALLREEGITDSKNIPHQDYLDQGYFKVVMRKWVDRNNTIRIDFTMRVYQKGVIFIDRLIERTEAKKRERAL